MLYGDHYGVSKGLARQPAEAPALKITRLKEFSDESTTSNFLINNRLGLSRAVEFPIDMEQKALKNLVRNIPYDSIYPDIQRVMNEGDWGEDRE